MCALKGNTACRRHWVQLIALLERLEIRSEVDKNQIASHAPLVITVLKGLRVLFHAKLGCIVQRSLHTSKLVEADTIVIP